MDLTEDKEVIWLSKGHPNYERWKRARDLSIERGKFVASVIVKFISLEKLTILDLGSGEGGTSHVLFKQNSVVSFDISKIRLQRQNFPNSIISKVNGDASFLPFRDNQFDLIIIQDVIEHLIDKDQFVKEVDRILKKNGYVFLSTPNKYSILNLIADPHFGIPFLSIMSRKHSALTLKFLGRKDYVRSDLAELLSLKMIFDFFNRYKISLNTVYAVEELLSGNKGIIWSDFHLYLLRIIHKLHLSKFILKLVNNNNGILNNYITPSFYIMLHKV